MKGIKVLLIVATLVPLSIVAFIYLTYYVKLEEKRYDFTRKIGYELKEFNRMDIKYDSYYFAGKIGDNIYLGNTTACRHLLRINPLLKDTQSIVIDLDTARLKEQGTYNVVIDSLNFFLYNGSAKSLFIGKTTDWTAKDVELSIYFTELLPISTESTVFKYVSAVTNSYGLEKRRNAKEILKSEDLFDIQRDGLFCVSGSTRYSKSLKMIVHTYFYRNQVLLIDTNLKIIKQFNTIDPMDSAQIVVSTVDSQNRRTISSSLLVNARTSISANYLYIHSKLMGKKEDEYLFNHSAVIDVYDLRSSRYSYSFYIPQLDGENISQIQVYDGYVYTLSTHFINRFKFRLPDLKIE